MQWAMWYTTNQYFSFDSSKLLADKSFDLTRNTHATVQGREHAELKLKWYFQTESTQGTLHASWRLMIIKAILLHRKIKTSHQAHLLHKSLTESYIVLIKSITWCWPVMTPRHFLLAATHAIVSIVCSCVTGQVCCLSHCLWNWFLQNGCVHAESNTTKTIFRKA